MLKQASNNATISPVLYHIGIDWYYLQKVVPTKLQKRKCEGHCCKKFL